VSTLSLPYRPDLDGLRAIAVLSVLVFHLDKYWLPGGFVGVDIFFVLSGFLITRLLITDLDRGGLSLARFYQRRIARLAPMIVVVVSATLLGAGLLYSAQDFASAGVNALAALLSVANVKFLLQGDYFQISVDAQPFLHFWSLSVEEQYYLFFPMILILLFRWNRSWVGWAVIALTALSFIACVLVAAYDPTLAFYLLPTRAWELGCGGVLAIYGARMVATLPQAAHHLLAVAGLSLIGTAFVLLDAQTRFPGYAAVLPVLGAALIILATERPGYLGAALLSSAPVVAIGQVSYGLYLWHWPIFSMVDYTLYMQSDLLRTLLKITLTGALTWATYRLIETPARQALNRKGLHWPVIAVFVIVAIAAIPVGLGIRNNFYIDANAAKIAKGGLTYLSRDTAPTVLLTGDSNGSMYGRMVRDVAGDMGWSAIIASVAAGDSLPRTGGPSSAIWQNSLELVAQSQPDVIVMANSWVAKLKHDPESLRLSLEALAPHTRHIVILDQIPVMPEGVDRGAFRDGLRGPIFETASERQAREEMNTYLREVAANVSDRADIRITVIDVATRVLRPDQSIPFSTPSGHLVFHDRTHLSDRGARLVASDIQTALQSSTERP
jgi:peptidoglycan/LPS O-acetylase OafA/YrhL